MTSHTFLIILYILDWFNDNIGNGIGGQKND